MHKINRFQALLILLAALFLHLTLLNYIKIFGAEPDLMLICVVFFALFFGPGAGFESGIAAGFLKDIFTLDFFGINAFTLGVTGLVAGVLNEKFSKESGHTQFVLVGLFTIFSMSVHFAFITLFSKSMALNFIEFLTTSAIPSSVYTALVGLPIFAKFIGIYNLKELEGLL